VGELLNQIKTEKVRHGKKSRLADILEKLPKDQRKDFIAALDDHSISASKICKVMARHGHKITPEIVSRYRRGHLRTDLHEVQ